MKWINLHIEKQRTEKSSNQISEMKTDRWKRQFDVCQHGILFVRIDQHGIVFHETNGISFRPKETKIISSVGLTVKMAVQLKIEIIAVELVAKKCQSRPAKVLNHKNGFIDHLR